MRQRAPRDAGMSLVEVVVAMLLLAVVAIAMLPLLLAGVERTAQNATRTSAVQLVAERMELAAVAGPDCASVEALAATRSATDADGRALTLTTTVSGACPSAGASGTLTVLARVVADATGTELARGTTEVYVRGGA